VKKVNSGCGVGVTKMTNKFNTGCGIGVTKMANKVNAGCGVLGTKMANKVNLGLGVELDLINIGRWIRTSQIRWKNNFDTKGIRIRIWIPIQLKALIEVCIKLNTAKVAYEFFFKIGQNF
jgi:hypothetical protein